MLRVTLHHKRAEYHFLVSTTVGSLSAVSSHLARTAPQMQMDPRHSPQANAQLAVVRESHERTGREVEACQVRIETLRGRVAELEREVEKAWQAYAVVDSEMEVRHLCSVLHVVFQRVQGDLMDCISCVSRHLEGTVLLALLAHALAGLVLEVQCCCCASPPAPQISEGA